MDRERLIGIVMVGSVVAAVLIYLFMNTQNNNLETQNEQLVQQVDELRTERESESNNNSEENESNIDSEVTVNNDENNSADTADNSSELQDSQFESRVNNYNETISEFLNTIYTVDDMEERESILDVMTTENSHQYLRENYFLLTQEDMENMQDSTDTDSVEEGRFEPLELNMEIESLQTFYMIDDDKNLEFVAMFRLITETDEENFSGNFVLKASLLDENGEVRIDEIQSITPLNDPNADDLFVSN